MGSAENVFVFGRIIKVRAYSSCESSRFKARILLYENGNQSQGRLRKTASQAGLWALLHGWGIQGKQAEGSFDQGGGLVLIPRSLKCGLT